MTYSSMITKKDLALRFLELAELHFESGYEKSMWLCLFLMAKFNYDIQEEWMAKMRQAANWESWSRRNNTLVEGYW